MADEDWPIKEYLRGEPVPDLSSIPREDWLRALGPLTRPARRRAMFEAPFVDGSDHRAFSGQLEEYDLDRADRLDRVRAATGAVAPVPTPEVGSTPQLRSRQINVKLGPKEHSELIAMAKAVGLKPTQLARQLVMNGVRRMRYEERRMSG
jgi:hypothetical protein